MVGVICIVQSCDRKLLEASDLGFFFQNIWEIPMVVAKTNSKRIDRGLEQSHSLNLAKSALVTSAAKDDWSRAEEK
jgi:hypothetical protein